MARVPAAHDCLAAGCVAASMRYRFRGSFANRISKLETDLVSGLGTRYIEVRMNVIAKSALVHFWSTLPKGSPRETAEAAMTEWYATASKASWGSFSELKKTFNSADIVAGNKVIFDVGGNKYRIVGLVAFRSKRIYVLFVGTHAQYDAIDVNKL